MAHREIEFIDPVYGRFSAASPVLVELIESPSLQRLKGIAQFGLPDEYYHIAGYSRFDHSVGVMRLLQILGASEEEVVAGLLHDMSHTAFSHVVDWLMGDTTKEDMQDKNHRDMVRGSEIPGILSRYGYDVERVCDPHRFSLLEQPSPGLCADRVDYALRELPSDVCSSLLSELTVADGGIVFSSHDAARRFAEEFLRMQIEHWGGFEAKSRYLLLVWVLRTALERGVINFQDLWKDDGFVLLKLIAAGHADHLKILAVLESRSLRGLPLLSTPVKCKFRCVDPKYLDEGWTVRVSETDKDFSDLLERARTQNDRGMRSVDVEACLRETGGDR